MSETEPPIQPPEDTAHRLARPLKDGELNTALVHFYRGELARSNTWRQRLDTTTNWAVVTTGAALTFAFGNAGNPPVVLLIITLLTTLFLFIEARRYRYYELWTHRIRLVETHFLAHQLSPGSPPPAADWTAHLAESLRRPAFPITLLEALGRRYRRNYAPLLAILAVSWLLKVSIHPTTVSSWPELIDRAAVGPVSGWAMLIAGVVFNAGHAALGLFTVGMRRTDAEVFGKGPRSVGRFLTRVRIAAQEALEVDLSAFKPQGRKVLVYVITDAFESIGPVILEELKRGVTLVKGVGMYSGKERGVLLCAVERRQAARLRKLVSKEDPEAFVIVLGTQDIRGEGFQPLET